MAELQRTFGLRRAAGNAAHFANVPRRRDELHQHQNRDEQPRANRKFAARQQKRKCAHDVELGGNEADSNTAAREIYALARADKL